MNLELEMRPNRLDNVLIPDSLRQRIRDTMTRDVMAYLFVGAPGTGKTTLANIVAHTLVGDPELSKHSGWVWTEMSCAEVNGAADLSAKLPWLSSGQQNVFQVGLGVERDVYFLDETHNLSPKGQEILQRYTERVGERRWIFCTTTMRKLGSAFLRRCQIFHLPGLQTPKEREELVRRAVVKTGHTAPVDAFLAAVEKYGVVSPGVILAAFQAHLLGADPGHALALYLKQTTKDGRAIATKEGVAQTCKWHHRIVDAGHCQWGHLQGERPVKHCKRTKRLKPAKRRRLHSHSRIG